MAIATLQANVPMLIAHFELVTTVYIKQYGPGNLRLGTTREELLATVSPLPVADGIVQVTADGFKQYFWEGDFWIISDAPGTVVYKLPSYEFYVDRGAHNRAPNTDVNLESELEGELSTYRR